MSSTSSNFILEMYFQFGKQFYMEFGLISLEGVVLVQTCVSPKAAVENVSKLFLHFFFKFVLTYLDEIKTTSLY